MRFSPNFKGHFAVVGNSGMGKGVLVSAVALAYRAKGIPVYLLTCKEDEYYTFPADFRTMDQDRFLEAVMGYRGKRLANGEEQALGLIAVIDEAWKWKWNGKLEEIPNAGRSRGIEMWAQGTRIVQMPPNVRGNCDNLVCFRQKSADDITDLVKREGPEFASAGQLQPGQFLATIGDRFERGTAWRSENGKFESISF